MIDSYNLIHRKYKMYNILNSISVLDKRWDHPGLIFIHQMMVTDFMQISKMNIIILLSRRSYEKAVYDIFLCFVDC